VTVLGADQAARTAGERPLLTLKLGATATAAAQKLAAVAQPFGADAVALTISASGDLRTGGTMSYAADGVKLTHPSRPLETATLVANSLADGSYFEATLVLSFGEGRHGLSPQLAQLEEHAADIRVECEFGASARDNA
jgi:hypothetical protein